jgi:hypothetical protein
MKAIKKATIGLVLGAVGFVAVNSASAAPVDAESMQTINSMIMQMQQKTMNELYAQTPPKDQMRGQKMQEFSSKLTLKNDIQPVMMQKNINSTMQVLMQQIMANPIPVPSK